MRLQQEPPAAAAVPTCDSIQSNRLLMYSGADMRVGFLIFMPSAHRYSYCKAGMVACSEVWQQHGQGEAILCATGAWVLENGWQLEERQHLRACMAQLLMSLTLGPADMTGQVRAVQNSSRVPNRMLMAL